MTRRYSVDWLESARRELFQIVDDLARQPPAAAVATLDLVEEKARSLETLPDRGRLIPELTVFSNRSYRELQIPPHCLLYRIDADKILVLGLFDSRRNLEEVILERVFRYLHDDA